MSRRRFWPLRQHCPPVAPVRINKAQPPTGGSHRNSFRFAHDDQPGSVAIRVQLDGSERVKRTRVRDGVSAGAVRSGPVEFWPRAARELRLRRSRHGSYDDRQLFGGGGPTVDIRRRVTPGLWAGSSTR
jgi:hypothetical protein